MGLSVTVKAMAESGVLIARADAKCTVAHFLNADLDVIYPYRVKGFGDFNNFWLSVQHDWRDFNSVGASGADSSA